MFLRIAKKESICHKCGGIVCRGEDIVHLFVQNNKNQGTTLAFHPMCYLEWYKDKFLERWNKWKNETGVVAAKPIGRPITNTSTDSGVIINRLKTSIHYHEKKGHTAKVEYLKNKLSKVAIS